MHKKRVLIFLPKFPVLTETFIARDLVKLVEIGDLDITVLALQKGTGSIPEVLLDKVYFESLNTKAIFVSISYLIKKPHIVIHIAKELFLNPLQTFDSPINKYEKVFPSFLFNFLNKLYFYMKVLGYVSVFAKYKADEIHAHFMSDSSTLALGSSMILNIPFSLTAHARDILEYPHLPNLKCKKAKFISICNKNAYNKCLEFSKKSSQKIFLIHHGYDLQSLLNTDYVLEKPKRQVIFAGGTRLEEKKGTIYLIDALELLVRKNENIELHLIALGSYYLNLKTYISEKKLDSYVVFHGDGNGISFSEVASIYKITDVLALPFITTSKGDADGVPNALIEGAMFKIPTVTTDAGSILEFAENNVSALIVAQKDAISLANAIEFLLEDKPKAQSFAENAHNKAVKMFDASLNVGKLNSLFLKD